MNMTEDLMKNAQKMILEAQKITNKTGIAKRKYITFDSLYFTYERDEEYDQKVKLGLIEEDFSGSVEKRVKVKRSVFLDQIIGWAESDEDGIIDLNTRVGTFAALGTFEEIEKLINNAD